MDPEPIPLEISCLGCKRYFLLSQKLPLESMTVEFKNYSFPIKESFLKDNLLRTIVGFLNSKGGTIFMGVNDSDGSVYGIALDRKRMDEFKLMIKQMLQRIQPSVDLIKKQEVSVDFVPVLEGKERSFYGKYVVKFIVLQGDPSKLYCLSEKVKVSGGKYDEADVISAFRRHNFGGIQEVRGIKVIHEIYEKAINPHRAFATFHENCNPTPLNPSLILRQKPEANQRIFADEDAQKKISSSQNNSDKGSSEKQSIIDIIEEKEKKSYVQKNSLIKKEDPIYVFFLNVKGDCLKSLINFLKNSTIAKTSLQVCGFNGVVRVHFRSQIERTCLIEQLEKSSMKRLVDGFGNNDKIKISKSAQNVGFNQIVCENDKTNQKDQEKNYTLIFHGYESEYEGSIQNYLQKCMTSNIQRKMKKNKQGFEIQFKSRKDMYLFESMCKKPPHSSQLDRFWPKGKALIKIKSRSLTQQTTKQPQKKIKKVVKMQEQDFPSLTTQPAANKLVKKQNQFHELIASSLDPSQITKLSNYLANNMFYNIQKKILLSKQRYYLRIIFNQNQECKKFLQYCHTEQHKSLLAQFSSAKILRIGFPGDSILIFPYTDQLKDEIKKLVLKVLGQGVIKTSAVKLMSNEAKVWSLNLVDSSKLLESYQKLENYFRKSPLFFNQQWILFKVFLDYKEFKQ